MVDLGVGKNMVRSIRFWVEVMGVAVPRPDRSLEATNFGRAVFAEGGFDPFLEDARTLWLLHWNIASRVEEPLYAWDYLLYKWPYAELSRSEALAAFVRDAGHNTSHSEVTLGQHLDVFLHTYIPMRATGAISEESLDCPLADLELLLKVGERHIEGSARREPVYAFRREAKPEVTTALFEYCVDDYWRRRPGEATISDRDLATAQGSVGQAFKLPEDDIRSRLDSYILSDTARPFHYQASAVQGLVFRHAGEKHDFLANVYLEEPSGR